MIMSSNNNSSSSLIPLSLFCGSVALYAYFTLNKVQNKPQKSSKKETKSSKQQIHEIQKCRLLAPKTITIAYATTTGTCRSLAETLHDKLTINIFKEYSVQLLEISELDWWDELLNDEDEGANGGTAAALTSDSEGETPILLFIVPTWSGGEFVENSRPLLNSLEEISGDWRVPSKCLKGKIKVSGFGMGSSAYDPETFNVPVKTLMKHFMKLGAKSMISIGFGDDCEDFAAQFESWCDRLIKKFVKEGIIKDSVTTVEKPAAVGCCKGGNDAAVDEGCACAEEKNTEEYESSDEEDEDEPDVMDLEDLGNAMGEDAQADTSDEPKEMITPKQASALKKEGYKLIGTHSAVKLCRWTKHQLRGRGGCYKHTHYGITSYQCMEATPSLACANKCVFCWRHHKNPVGREWRWKTDEPDFIIEQAVNTHVKMIKEAKGIPGVLTERWEEAHTVRHCALSLVGEPIMYPKINQLLQELHDRDISTFLVTNGQHPAAIETLIPITQLYVSVDASTPESLEAVDRPLFKDAWERLCTSLALLKEKGQRTVARLTVVKGWNSDEIKGYAELCALGAVSLIEVKGVTFCGKSDASNLTMSNTPWHHEVIEFTRKLQAEMELLTEKGGDDAPPLYGLACEHKHSCSVLLARKDQFMEEDPATGEVTWHTWIDYPKFQELAEKHRQDPSFKFSVRDYTAPTPAWATFGNEHEGFDPTDTRYYKKNKRPKYTKFDVNGIPTHDAFGEALSESEMQRLKKQMDEMKKKVGTDVSLVSTDGGTKEVVDPSLMFRGLVIGD